MRILFAGDRSDLDRAVDHFRKAGMEARVAAAADRAELEARLLAEPFDVVLLDHDLAGPDFEELHWLASHGIETPVILLIGAIGEETAVEAVKTGAADCVRKNDLGRLPTAIRRALADKCDCEAALRKEQERYGHLNRLYSVLSHLNQAIVRINDRDELLREVCRIAVEDGRFRMAWFGLVDPSTGRVAPAAYSGFEDGYLAGLRISVADEPMGRGPTGTALREGRRFFCNDIENTEYMLPWRGEAVRRGYRSSAAFPVKVGGNLVGAFTIYSAEPGFFNDEELNLMEEVAADVSFALDSMEREAQRQRAEQARLDLLLREESARALEESSRQIAQILESVTDGFFALDSKWRVTYVNRKAETTVERSRDGLLGRNFWVEFPDLAGSVFHEQLDRAARERVPMEFEAFYPARRMHLDFHVYPSENGLSVYFQDVTQRNHLQEQLRQSQKMEAVGRLAGGVAHDFNNLLTIIGGYGQMVVDAAPDARTRKDVEAIVEAANRASLLTRQLLAFSRRQIVQPKVLDLNKCVLKMHKILRRVIGEDVELELNLAPPHARVKIDPSQIEQVLMNLAVNARDAMPQGGKLLIETGGEELHPQDPPKFPGAVPGEYVTLTVSDTGTGMDAEVLSHLFEPFFTTKPKGKGTGLGLSTVYGVIKQSGGDILVDSETGRGSIFRIYLPRVRQAPTAQRAPAVQPDAWRGSETILLVEDEAEVRKLAHQLLVHRGYHVLQASSGAAALRVWQRHQDKIQLLLTDVVMPRMSGRELAEELRTRRPGLKVLYMSGYTDEVIARHGIDDSGTAFLQKPFKPEALARKIRGVLDAPPDPPARRESC